MATRHPSPRCEPDIHRPDLPPQVQIQPSISHRYAFPFPNSSSTAATTAYLPPLTNQARLTCAINSIEPPEVTFVAGPDRPIPMHPHIYSNGIICLDLLGTQGWSPVQNVESICMSLQSMLTGNTKNERPEGDEQFVASNRRRPRDIDFYYHDNTV